MKSWHGDVASEPKIRDRMLERTGRLERFARTKAVPAPPYPCPNPTWDDGLGSLVRDVWQVESVFVARAMEHEVQICRQVASEIYNTRPPWNEACDTAHSGLFLAVLQRMNHLCDPARFPDCSLLGGGAAPMAGGSGAQRTVPGAPSIGHGAAPAVAANGSSRLDEAMQALDAAGRARVQRYASLFQTPLRKGHAK